METKIRELEGKRVRLIPQTEENFGDLWKIIDDDSIWRYYSRPKPKNIEEHKEMYAQLHGPNNISGYSYNVYHKETGKAIGSYSFIDIQRRHKTAEIGFIFVSDELRGQGFNTEICYLLLQLMFEEWGAYRMTWKTDVRNSASRRAVEKLGGTFEGVLRSHYIMSDGFRRDSAYYSILDTEWPEIKKKLEKDMGW